MRRGCHEPLSSHLPQVGATFARNVLLIHTVGNPLREMLQDLKVGHMLVGTHSKMQVGDIFGIVVAALVLLFPLMVLDDAYHFGSAQLPAPQAGLMAMLAQGIVGGNMAWPLVIVGILMGIAMIMVEVKSPMLFSVGMYLPIETTFAIFLG